HVEEVLALRDRLHRESETRATNNAYRDGFDLKRERGGIRQIEMHIQVLQLLHGGKEPSLRGAQLRNAAEQLFRLGLLPQQEYLSLWRDYGRLRRLENLVQLLNEQQQHRLPQNSAELERLAWVYSQGKHKSPK